MDIIKHGFLIHLLWIKGVVAGGGVTQTDILWKDEGDRATMDCSHTKGVNYNQMYWYRQLPGKAMEQVVLTGQHIKADFEQNFRGEKFSVTKPNTDNGTFTVKDLVPGDNGLYFCAVSEHSDAGDSESCANTPQALCKHVSC